MKSLYVNKLRPHSANIAHICQRGHPSSVHPHQHILREEILHKSSNELKFSVVLGAPGFSFSTEKEITYQLAAFFSTRICMSEILRQFSIFFLGKIKSPRNSIETSKDDLESERNCGMDEIETRIAGWKRRIVSICIKQSPPPTKETPSLPPPPFHILCGPTTYSRLYPTTYVLILDSRANPRLIIVWSCHTLGVSKKSTFSVSFSDRRRMCSQIIFGWWS